MTLKVDRFEKISLKKVTDQFALVTTSTMLIKDHKSDRVIAHIDLSNLNENNELAGRIITTIETFIEEHENATED